MSEKRLEKFGNFGEMAAGKDIGQLHNPMCFLPTHTKDLNANERYKAQRALGCLTKKNNGAYRGMAVKVTSEGRR